MAYVDICLQDRQSCPNKWPVMAGYQNTEYDQEIRILNDDSVPYDLTCKQVLFQAKEAYWCTEFVIRKDVEIMDAPAGIIRIHLAHTEVQKAGLFIGELVVHQEPDSSSTSPSCPANPDLRILYRLPIYFEVTPALDFFNPTPQGISLAEVRLAIRDNCAEDNFLLDSTEFSAQEIAHALRRPVDYWNEALPPLTQKFTTATFPYRYNWLEAAIGELMVMAALNYNRNNLTYSAGGVSVDDKNKAQAYMQAGEMRRKDYKAWVRLTKMSLNAQNAIMQTTIRSFGDRYVGI